MKLEDILLENTATVKEAISRLEKVRCKVVYILTNNKLTGSISDGDIRRYSLHNGNIDCDVSEIENKNPQLFYENQKEQISEFFKRTDAWSAPIINYNGEVIAVLFRSGKIIRKKNLMDCPVVINAGGKGTRLYPYTHILPKALIPIGDIPIAERIIRSFTESGSNQFYMIVNHKKKMIKAYFEGSESKYPLEFLDEKSPLGTGGGLYMVKGKIKNDFFFSNCDILIDADYSSMYNEHKQKKNDITIIGAHYKNEIPYGVIDIGNENEYIQMREKPNTDCIVNTGLYIIHPRVLELIPPEIEISFPEIIEKVKNEQGKVGVYVVDESAYMDMGQLEELNKMQKKLTM